MSVARNRAADLSILLGLFGLLLAPLVERPLMLVGNLLLVLGALAAFGVYGASGDVPARRFAGLAAVLSGAGVVALVVIGQVGG